jgi:hypothetical protein
MASTEIHPEQQHRDGFLLNTLRSASNVASGALLLGIAALAWAAAGEVITAFDASIESAFPFDEGL